MSTDGYGERTYLFAGSPASLSGFRHPVTVIGKGVEKERASAEARSDSVVEIVGGGR